jgi:hypothetical protein
VILLDWSVLQVEWTEVERLTILGNILSIIGKC